MKAFIIETQANSIEFAYSLFGVNISLEDTNFTYCTKCRNEMKALIRAFTQTRAEFGSEKSEEAYECLEAIVDEFVGLWSTNEFNPSNLDWIDETTYGGKPYAREYLLSETRDRISDIEAELYDNIEF